MLPQILTTNLAYKRLAYGKLMTKNNKMIMLTIREIFFVNKNLPNKLPQNQRL
jgi:hypothetical protein